MSSRSNAAGRSFVLKAESLGEFVDIDDLGLAAFNGGYGLAEVPGVRRRAEQVGGFHPRTQLFGRDQGDGLLLGATNQDRLAAVGHRIEPRPEIPAGSAYVISLVMANFILFVGRFARRIRGGGAQRPARSPFPAERVPAQYFRARDVYRGDGEAARSVDAEAEGS